MTSSKDKFIKIVKDAELIQFNYPHYNDPYFYPGHSFSYRYEGVFDDNVACLKKIQEFIIEYCEELGDKKFEEGGWSAEFEINSVVDVYFQVAGGPGSSPPCCQ